MLWTTLVTGSLVFGRSLASSDGYFAQYFQNCPTQCSEAGLDTSNWTQIHHANELNLCDKPILFSMNLHGVAAPDAVLNVPACVPADAASGQRTTSALGSVRKHSINNTALCGARSVVRSVIPTTGGSFQEEPQLVSGNPPATDVANAVGHLSRYLEQAAPCGTTIMFAKSGSSIAGMFVGSQLANSAATKLLQKFLKQPSPQSLQVCSRNITTAFNFGVVASVSSDLVGVQSALRLWSEGSCLGNGTPASETGIDVLVSTLDKDFASAISQNSSVVKHDERIQQRGSCRTEQVISGDLCAALASRCGISSSDLLRFNQQKNFCNNLKVKQFVCCSEGELPDVRPQPDSDGNCNVYSANEQDGCWIIADKHYITIDDIERFNKHTWGWKGCKEPLMLHQKLCISSGEPPMPAVVPGAVCGPQADTTPPTSRPPKGVSLETLNPCPLNACCDVWGFCGTTSEFCTKSPSDTGAPGTAMAGNGCISNCEMEIVRNSAGPEKFMSVGYYEAFNYERDCLVMPPSAINENKYTHIHFAFATVTPSWQVDISHVEYQFEKFLELKRAKKILSFGGWAFSTEPSTFQTFRDATKPQNRLRFARNVAEFAQKHDVDGLDFDWEYPGAPDIPDIPPGGSDEGQNYFAFLFILRRLLPSEKSLSIALPASFWYLKQYPVQKIAGVVDYFIYMTYDLHGQWDVGNKWSIPGCEGGNCLRSHINKTETYNALTMITKAGVDSNKVVVGVSSYGRSFRMADSSCDGPMCTFTGTRLRSDAWSGRCTKTPGYISNAEIYEVLEDESLYKTAKMSHDPDSDSDILIYGNDIGTDWVAFMSIDTKNNRSDWLQGLNFAGTSDWAVDLQSFVNAYDEDGLHAVGVDPDAFMDTEQLLLMACLEEDNPGSLQSIADSLGTIPSICVPTYTLSVLHDLLESTLEEFEEITSGSYDNEFDHYEKWVEDTISSRLDGFMSFNGGKGNEFFHCTWSTSLDEDSEPCASMRQFWKLDLGSYEVHYELIDEQGFYDAAEKELGIEQEWISFGHWHKHVCDPDYADPDSTNHTHGNPSGCLQYLNQDKYGYPQRGDKDKIHVPNPKTMVLNSMENITALSDTILATYGDLAMGNYHQAGSRNDEADPITAVSLPVFQLMDVIDNLKAIKKIGDTVIEKEHRDLIFKILNIVLLVLPFVGEVLGVAGETAAAVGRIAVLLADVANPAVTIAEIVKDPTSAPFEIIGLFAGAMGVSGPEKKLTPRKSLEEAADIRKALGADKMKKFSDAFREKDALTQKIAGSQKCKI